MVRLCQFLCALLVWAPTVGPAAEPASAEPSSAEPSSAEPSSAEPSSAEPSSAESAAKKSGDDELVARAGLVGGQAIVGKLLEPEITVQTPYGELRVPFDEIVRIRFGVRLPEEKRAELEKRVAAMDDAGPDSDEGREAIALISELGLDAVPTLRKLRAKFEKEATTQKLGELEDEILGDREIYVGEDDEVTSERFTMRGRIVDESFRIESLVGTLAIPREDLRLIAFRETEVTKSWKIGPQYLENRNSFASKIKVRKGQKIKLEPSGTMTYNGQIFGPAGLRHYTWNGRQMGCLQWRIGSAAPWQILATTFKDRAPASGPIEFCLHHTGGSLGGEFTVKFKTSTE